MDRAEVKRFYDHFGRRQDSQSFYEDAAVADLLRHSELATATRVYEFGCGTGRIAAEMLATVLPEKAIYEGVDLSSTMVSVARQRLASFGERAIVRQIEGSDPFEGVRGEVDRIVTTYVLDLLSDEEITRFIERSAATLQPGGKLSIASLTSGATLLSRAVTAAWRSVYRVCPRLVGGCRPIRLLPYFFRGWRIEHHATITAFGVASEIVVATPAGDASHGYR